jgi:hypothetical protein
MAENEICCLKDNLINEKKRCSDQENEVKDFKRQSSDWREASAKVSITEFDEFGSSRFPDIKGSQLTDFQDVQKLLLSGLKIQKKYFQSS